VPLATAAHTHVLTAARSGVIQRIDCLATGVAVWRLGAGRARKEDPVAAAAGAVFEAKVGDTVAAGDPIMVLHADDLARFDGALDALDDAITIGDAPVAARPLVIDRIA
jgi:thymidine phosphorylase